jgi:DNA-binding GntR family transcriptional regulator
VSEGLVEVQPRSGTFVARIDPREVAETFDLRGALEALAGELAAVRATDADLDGLEAIAHSLDETGRSGDVGRHVGANVDFHGRIIELSGNRRLAGVYRQLGAMTAVAAIHHRWQDWRTRLDQERSEHLAIVAALRARDPAAVVRATREHIVRGKAEVLAGLEAITRR